jgi:hypothetical protein
MKPFIALFLVTCCLAIAQPECSLHTLRGTYIVSYTGVITTPTGTVNVGILGVTSIDPGTVSHISGGVTFTGLGPTPLYVPATGTVQVNPDCTGVINLGNPATGASEVDQFIYDRDTKTLVATVLRISIGPAVGLGTWKQISSIPRVVTWPAPPK